MSEELDFIVFLNKSFENNNIENIINSCYSVGIRENEFKKDYSSLINNISNSLIAKLNEKKILNSKKETNKTIKINIINEYKNYPTSPINIIIPVFPENISNICVLLNEYIINNKINCTYIFIKNNVNNLFTIVFYDVNDAKKFHDYYINEKTLNKEIKNKVMSIVPNYLGLGIYTEIFPYDYITFFNTIICEYLNTVEKKEKIKIENLIKMVKEKESKEINYLKKEMYGLIHKSIDIINTRKSPFLLFNYNAEMNIGSYDISNYNIKLDENKLIYFENKERTMLILFGSEEYLNMCYTKCYENIIEKESNLTFYNYFKNIYKKILESRFEKIFELLDFSSLNNDIIYQELMLVSSGYFAYKKLDFDYDLIYTILKKVFEKKLDCEIKYESDESKFNTEKKFVFPFNVEYGNKVVDLKDGSKITIYDYFRSNKVLDLIPLNSKLFLKDGSTIEAKEYLESIYSVINKYDNFKEMFEKEIEFIELND